MTRSTVSLSPENRRFLAKMRGDILGEYEKEMSLGDAVNFCVDAVRKIMWKPQDPEARRIFIADLQAWLEKGRR